MVVRLARQVSPVTVVLTECSQNLFFFPLLWSRQHFSGYVLLGWKVTFLLGMLLQTWLKWQQISLVVSGIRANKATRKITLGEHGMPRIRIGDNMLAIHATEPLC